MLLGDEVVDGATATFEGIALHHVPLQLRKCAVDVHHRKEFGLMLGQVLGRAAEGGDGHEQSIDTAGMEGAVVGLFLGGLVIGVADQKGIALLHEHILGAADHGGIKGR